MSHRVPSVNEAVGEEVFEKALFVVWSRWIVCFLFACLLFFFLLERSGSLKCA